MSAGDFSAYVARKEAAAAAAALSPWVTEFDAHDGDQLAIGNEWSRAQFGGPFYVSPPAAVDRPSSSLVFVQSRSGNTGASDPSALGGGATDTHLVYEGLSRVAADAVLGGAETLRSGKTILSVWHPQMVALRRSLGLPRHPIQVVATLRGIDIREGLLYNVPELHVVVITVATWAKTLRTAIEERPWIDTIVMERPDALAAAMRELRGMGVKTLSCIGGRSLAGQLLDAGLVDDVYLTTSAKEGGEPNTPMYAKRLAGKVVLRKRGTEEDRGVSFEHWRMGTSTPA